MSFKISTIKIRNFRGVRRLDLPAKGRNLIICGENGSGKSSIVDALEYYFTGHLQHLEGRGDVNTSECIPHLKGDGATEVNLAFKGLPLETDVAIGYPKRDVTIPSQLESFFKLAASSTFVLRRHQLLQFINARDAERYKQVSQLIGLEALDTIDDKWRREHRATQKRVSDLQQERQAIQDRLGELLARPIETQTELIQAINARLVTHPLAPIANQKDLERHIQTLHRQDQLQDFAQAERLQKLQAEIAELRSKIDTLLAQNTQLHHSIELFCEQSAALEDAPLEKLLTEGYRVLQQDPKRDKCPLCKAIIPDLSALLQSLNRRIAKLRAMTQNRKQMSEQKDRLKQELAACASLLDSISGVQTPSTNQPALGAARKEIGDWQATLDQTDWITRQGQPPSIVKLKPALSQMESEISKQLACLKPTHTESPLLTLLVTMTRVDEQWQQLHRTERDLKKARHVSQQIDLVYKELVAARKRGLEQLCQDLEKDFERFYQQLHPDEGYESITLPVQRKRRSSIALRATYHDQQKAHPLGYFSEGHLDSLGLCVFLAFLKRFNQDLKLIILDDVLTTVDAGHRLRVARLLAREFQDYQFVITTHDRLWAKELDCVLPGTRLFFLKRWSIDCGTDCLQRALSDWEYYKDQARNNHPQDAIAGTGRNLEKFLYQMRGNLGLAVPAKRYDDYTIGDLYPVFFKWVNKSRIERPDRPKFIQELKALEDELDQVWRLRNWSGAHFNQWAETVTPEEAIGFIMAVKRLVEAFECPVCKSLVLYNASAKALICPSCAPSPPPRVVWQYKPGWQQEATKLVNATKPKVKRNAVPMVQRQFEHFLHDARHRLDFPVLAKPYDQYNLAHLYEPFFKWAMTHPRPEADDWPHAIQQCKQILDDYWHRDQWLDIPPVETERFVTAVQRLTILFECSNCAQLLDYDDQQGAYFCRKCQERESIPSPVSAYWFVRT